MKVIKYRNESRQYLDVKIDRLDMEGGGSTLRQPNWEFLEFFAVEQRVARFQNTIDPFDKVCRSGK